MYHLLDAAHAMLKSSWDIWGRAPGIWRKRHFLSEIVLKNIVSILFFHLRSV
jgi:hypothetical protein